MSATALATEESELHVSLTRAFELITILTTFTILSDRARARPPRRRGARSQD